MTAVDYIQLLDEFSYRTFDARGVILNVNSISAGRLRDVIDEETLDQAQDRGVRLAVLLTIEEISRLLSGIVEVRVGEGEGDLLGPVPDGVDGLGEFAQFLRLCAAGELGGRGGAGGDLPAGFFERLASRLHETTPSVGPVEAGTSPVGGAATLDTSSADDPTVGAPTDSDAETTPPSSSVAGLSGGGVAVASAPDSADTSLREITARVRQAIRASGRTKRWVSEESGIPYATLNRKLAGKTDFTFRELFALADVLKVSPASFMPRAFRLAVSA